MSEPGRAARAARVGKAKRANGQVEPVVTTMSIPFLLLRMCLHPSISGRRNTTRTTLRVRVLQLLQYLVYGLQGSTLDGVIGKGTDH